MKRLFFQLLLVSDLNVKDKLFKSAIAIFIRLTYFVSDIAKEKAPQLAANFDKNDLKSVETVFKSGLPTPDEYAREKVKALASNFDHSELKHVEPQVKTNVAVIEEQ
uniref:Uncharacterized protein n=1 Tax=Panagrolaimus superbus TaxID=310955 RepID=A0A914Y1N7_9BILA